MGRVFGALPTCSNTRYVAAQPAISNGRSRAHIGADARNLWVSTRRSSLLAFSRSGLQSSGSGRRSTLATARVTALGCPALPWVQGLFPVGPGPAPAGRDPALHGLPGGADDR